MKQNNVSSRNNGVRRRSESISNTYVFDCIASSSYIGVFKVLNAHEFCYLIQSMQRIHVYFNKKNTLAIESLIKRWVSMLNAAWLHWPLRKWQVTGKICLVFSSHIYLLDRCFENHDKLNRQYPKSIRISVKSCTWTLMTSQTRMYIELWFVSK